MTLNSFFAKLFENFWTYIQEAKIAVSSFEFWIYPVGVIIITWLLAIVISKVAFKRKHDNKILKKTFNIHKSWIISSSLTSLVVICIICIYWSKDVYKDHEPPLEFSHLLSLIIALFFGIVSLLKLRSYYKRSQIVELVKYPLTANAFSNSLIFVRKAFNKMKFWLLVPAFGFLFLFMARSEYYLLSVVLDTSVSMYPYEIEKGKKALNNTFEQLSENTTVIFTTLLRTPDQSYDEIINMSISESPDLNAFTAIFSPIEAIDFITNKIYENSEFGFSEGTPLTEGLWQNYLYAKEQVNSEKTFNERRLIIITDGGENIMSMDPVPLCESEFHEIYNEENTIIIDLLDGEFDEYPFFNILIDYCNYEREYGSTLDDYTFALERAVDSLRGANWYIVFWAILFYILFLFSCILIKPRKIISS